MGIIKEEKMKYLLAIITLTLIAFTWSLDVSAQNGPPADFVDGVVLVKFKPGAAKNKKKEAVDSVSGNTEEEYNIVPGLQKITTNLGVEEAIEILSKNPNVEFAEPDFIVSINGSTFPNDTYFPNLYGMHDIDTIPDNDIDGPEVWNIFTGDTDQLIAVIDTGVDYNHPDLNDNMWVNPGESGGGKETNGIDDDGNGYIDDVHGINSIYAKSDPRAGDPLDDHDHGTHVSGTICGEGNNGIGVTGVNWQCNIMALKFLSSSGSGSTSNAVECLEYALARGAKISSNSWGGGGFSSSLSSALTTARNAGHIFVAAAGNTVASTTDSGNKSSFSSYGVTSVDVGAPGSSILSTVKCDPNCGYAYFSGTSMATPHVAGVVGLVYALNPGLTHQAIINRIFNNVKLPSNPSALAGITVTGGIVDAECAVLDCDAGGPTPTPPPPTPTPTPTPTPPPPTPTPTPPPPTPTPTPDPYTDYSVDNQDIIDGQIFSGSLSSTYTDDDIDEVLRENTNGGKPDNRVSVLEKHWTINETCPSNQLIVHALYDFNDPDLVGFDNFIFQYQETGGGWTNMFIIEPTETTEQQEIVNDVPTPLTIRVIDSDGQVGNNGRDRVAVDYISLRCYNDGTLPPSPSPSPTPSTSPSPTPTPDPDDCVPTHPKEKGPRCSDGINNDCDEFTDGDDPDCQ
jgi:subtilisin family serine protease